MGRTPHLKCGPTRTRCTTQPGMAGSSIPITGAAAIKKSVDTDTYDAWGYIGYSSSGDEYFEIYQDGSPDDPVVTMWVNGYEDHIEPIIDGDAWVLDAPIPEEEGYNFVLYPYDGGMSVWSYPYESPDGTWGCYVNFYMRIDGDEWDEMWDTLPPRYEEYKATLAG